MVRGLSWLVVAGATSLACTRQEAPAMVAAAPAAAIAAPKAPGGSIDPSSVLRVTPAEARASVQAGRALLVCAYGDEKCAQLKLEGSISFSALEARLSQLPKDQEIIVYCA